MLVCLLFLPSTMQNPSFRSTGKMQSQARHIQYVLHRLICRDACKSKAATERSKTLPRSKSKRMTRSATTFIMGRDSMLTLVLTSTETTDVPIGL